MVFSRIGGWGRAVSGGNSSRIWLMVPAPRAPKTARVPSAQPRVIASAFTPASHRFPLHWRLTGLRTSNHQKANVAVTTGRRSKPIHMPLQQTDSQGLSALPDDSRSKRYSESVDLIQAKPSGLLTNALPAGVARWKRFVSGSDPTGIADKHSKR